MNACRLCGPKKGLTKHHLLKKKSARIVQMDYGLKNRTVLLCRTCHNRFHFGPPYARQAAWDELMPLLTDAERRLRNLRPILELWERKLEARA